MDGKGDPNSRIDDIKKACLIRNQNEKKRRDRLNSLVSELCADLPVMGKKLSKNNVLRYATEYFRQEKLAASTENNNFKRIYGSWQPEFLTNEEFCQTMHIGLNQFFLVLNLAGKILHVSYNVFSTLGYDADQLVNTCVLDYVHAEDHCTIYSLLKVFNQSGSDSVPLQTTWFSCRLRCGPQRTGSEFTEVRCVSGFLRGIDGVDNTHEDSSFYLVLLGKLAIHPLPNKTIVVADGNSLKFTARLNAKWRFECVERSATRAVGYYPYELLGTCFYEYCHSDDLTNLAEYHNMLPYSGVITTCYYRFLTKGQVWLWVRSRCHVSYSQLDSRPESVICVTWPIRAQELKKNQVEILERDRQLFSQILMKNEKKMVNSTSANSNSKHYAKESRCLSPSSHGSIMEGNRSLCSTDDVSSNFPSENTNLSSDTEPTDWSHLTSGRICVSSATSDTNLMSRTASSGGQPSVKTWKVDTVSVWGKLDNGNISNGPVACCYAEDADDSTLLLEDNFEIPRSLSFAQWALHVHLREQYKQLTESIRQQSEQISTIQKQLSIQRELSELSDDLEIQQTLREQNIKNKFEETKQTIRKKLTELREASYCLSPVRSYSNASNCSSG